MVVESKEYLLTRGSCSWWSEKGLPGDVTSKNEDKRASHTKNRSTRRLQVGQLVQKS